MKPLVYKNACKHSYGIPSKLLPYEVHFNHDQVYLSKMFLWLHSRFTHDSPEEPGNECARFLRPVPKVITDKHYDTICADRGEDYKSPCIEQATIDLHDLFTETNLINDLVDIVSLYCPDVELSFLALAQQSRLNHINKVSDKVLDKLYSWNFEQYENVAVEDGETFDIEVLHEEHRFLLNMYMDMD